MWRRFSEEERQTIWDMREAGVPVKRIARHLGRQNVSLRKFIADAGGKRPHPSSTLGAATFARGARGDLERSGGRRLHPCHRRGSGLLTLDGVPRSERQRWAEEVPGPVPDRAACRRAL